MKSPLNNAQLGHSKFVLCLLLLVFSNLLVKAQEIIWASAVVHFSSEKSNKAFGAIQVIGKPNRYPNPAFSTCAWSPEYNESRSEEFIEVTFEHAVIGKQILVVENNNSGHIKSIQIVFEDKTTKQVYIRTSQAISGPGRLFVAGIKDNLKPIQGIKIVFDQPELMNTYQIDAIGISTSTEPPMLSINTTPDPLNNKAISLGPNVNSPFDEVYPIISPDGSTIYFDRKVHPGNIGMAKNDDIWVAQKIDGNWAEAENIGPPLNNENHNFICSISPDGNTALVGNVYLPAIGNGAGVSLTHKKMDGWTLPQPVKINNFSNLNQYNEFCISGDRGIMVMSLETSAGKGLLDLYVSFLQADGSYSTPKNFGSAINTAGNEMTPFLAADGKTIYFSSNGFPGYGNQDIFMAKRLDNSWTNWTEPLNLGSEVNTPEWDVYYSIDAKGEIAYFSSSKTNGTNLDIFSIKLPPQAKPEDVLWLKGVVSDRITSLPINADLTIKTISEPINFGFTNSSISSGYALILQQFGSYQIQISADGYYVNDTVITIDSLIGFDEIIKNFSLIPRKEGLIIEMKNILFKVNSSVLEDSSFQEIDKIVRFMKSNNGVAIEIRGHTNGLCDDDYCNMLSEKRAKAVVEYLIDSGIERNRLAYKGLGKTQPIADNKTVAGRQANQRVEFMITKTE